MNAEPGSFGLGDDERDRAVRLRRRENTRAVRGAVQLEPRGKPDDNRLPRNVSTPAFLQLCKMHAGFDLSASLKPCPERLLIRAELVLELGQPVPQGQNQFEFELRNRVSFGEMLRGNYERGNFRCSHVSLQLG